MGTSTKDEQRRLDREEGLETKMYRKRKYIVVGQCTGQDSAEERKNVDGSKDADTR